VKKLLGNQLLFGSLVAFTIYWTLGLILPNPIISTTASLLLFIGGCVSSWKYVPPAFEIVALNRRVEDVQNERDYYPVYGSALLALGAVYTGLFGLTWSLTWWFTGTQPDWSGTAISAFGRALMAGGFLFLFLGPAEPRDGLRLPNVAWLAFVIFLCIAAAFLAGVKVATPEDTQTFFKIHGRNIAACDASNPYWISSSGRIHGPLSPYRWQIKPKQCFPTQQAAIDAGYRPIGWAKSDATFQMLKRSATDKQPMPEAKE